MDRLKLKALEISGFKSIDAQGESIDFGDVTVLLGANGAGKSNLVAFFEMLNYMMTGALQHYIGEKGYANSLLHFGSKVTPLLEAKLQFESDDATDKYRFKLVAVAGDTLMFTNEELEFQSTSSQEPLLIELGAGHKESGLKEGANRGKKTIQFIYRLLSTCRVFQFHDTSATAKIRLQGYIEDNSFLRSNGGNLAAFLYGLKSSADGSKYYDRIIRHIQGIMPQFEDFELSPSVLNPKYISLNWREKGVDYLFGSHQISDGTLRFAALATLLLQPPRTLPGVVILDEPELGLHPSAIGSLAAMVRSASRDSQVILATQSPRLVDEFDAEEIVIVEYDTKAKRSKFRRLSHQALADWLQRYSLSELWEKNVLGGRP